MAGVKFLPLYLSTIAAFCQAQAFIIVRMDDIKRSKINFKGSLLV